MNWTRLSRYGREQLFDLLHDPYELNDLFNPSPPFQLIHKVYNNTNGTMYSNFNMTTDDEQQQQSLEELKTQLRNRHNELKLQIRKPYLGENSSMKCERGQKYV